MTIFYLWQYRFAMYVYIVLQRYSFVAVPFRAVTFSSGTIWLSKLNVEKKCENFPGYEESVGTYV